MPTFKRETCGTKKLILGRDMGLKKGKGNKWLDWSKDKAAPAELGFACQTLRRSVVPAPAVKLTLG